MIQTATGTLVAGLETLAFGPLPDDLRHAARLRLLDTLGCLLAGAEMLRSSDDRTLDLLALSATEGPSAVIGFSRRTDPQTAALVNGMSCRMTELDDGHRYGIVHAGAVLLPALLSVLHHPAVTEERFLRALLVGYEAAIRVARTLQPMAKDLGWHGTGTFGCLGAATGVATALGGTSAQLHAALSAGATSASGLLSVIRGASELKAYNSGQASQAGLSAALTAMAGFRGPEDVLGGRQGLLDILSGGAPLDPQGLVVAAPYCVETVYLKPYASCRYAHAPVEAVMGLRAAHGVTANEVDRVEVKTFRLAVFEHDYTEIAGVSSAKLSVPYCVAAALTSGETGMAAFGEAVLNDPATLALTRRVRVTEDPALTALVPHRRPAAVTLHLRDGRALTARVDLPKGEPETALSDAELRDKFVDLAVFGGYDAAEARAMAETLLSPEAPKLPLLRALR